MVATDNYNSRRSNPFGTILVLLMVFAIAWSALPVIFGSHAVDKHGDDARAVRRCMMDDGPQMVYQVQDTYYLICKLADGRFGLQAVKRGAYKLYHELTAFVKGNGTIDELMAYMQRIGANPVSELPGYVLPAILSGAE